MNIENLLNNIPLIIPIMIYIYKVEKGIIQRLSKIEGICSTKKFCDKGE